MKFKPNMQKLSQGQRSIVAQLLKLYKFDYEFMNDLGVMEELPIIRFKAILKRGTYSDTEQRILNHWRQIYYANLKM